jgi:V8-like Glu-specific endopeptidase
VTRGRLAVVGIALIALAIGPAQPAPPPSAPPPPPFWPPPVLSRERAVAQVVQVDSRGGGAFDSGTGVSVGAHVVLTNAHLTRDPVTLVTRCGDQELKVGRIDRADAADAALLVTAGPNLLPAALAEHDPNPGDAVLVAGYPGGHLTLADGHVEGTLRQADGSAVLRFSPEPQTGQSGSPLLDADGRVAGLVYARDTAGGQGLAIPASGLRAMLDQARASGVPVAAVDIGDPAAMAARSSPCG